MKIAIFSDLHDDLKNLNQLINYCQKEKIKELIFCGDLTREATLNYLLNNFSGKIFMVGGNADLFDQKILKNNKKVIFELALLKIKIEGLKIFVAHKPKDLEMFLKNSQEKPDFAFHGHTHRPWIKSADGIIIANPGTLNGPSPQASFAILDSKTKKLELKIVSQI